MEQRSHQREVRQVDPAWSVSELMARIAKALVSDGPALALTPISQSSLPSRIALVVTTTGSSGVAKEVALSGSALLASAKASNKYLGAEFGATWSLLLPLNHIAGINVLIRSLESGTIPVNLMGYEGKYPKVDFTAIVPTQLYRALNGDENLLNHLQGARAVLVGGAALTHELRERAELLGIKVVESYGSTETSGGCIYDGTPLDGVVVELRDEGRVAISGKTLAHSYLNIDQELVDENGWYLTSDAGRIVDGKLFIDGRIDDVIVSGGENLSLSSVERVLSQTFPNLQFAIFAVEDPQWGHALHCAIIGGRDLEGSINEILHSEIGTHAKVKGFHYCSEFPLVGIGKIDKRELARRVSGGEL